MIESINDVIERLEYNSLVLLYEACNDLKIYASKDLTYTEELLEHFMKDEELEQDVKYNNILERIPYDGESFAYSVKDFSADILWNFIEFFGYAYSVTGKELYKDACKYIDMVLEYRRQMIDITFSYAKKIGSGNIDFYIDILPKETLDKMRDYMVVGSREITVDYLIEKFNKVKSLGSV